MSGPGYLVPYVAPQLPFSDVATNYSAYENRGPCATCSLMYQFTAGDFVDAPSNLAMVILGIISLGVVAYCIFNQKRHRMGSAVYQGALFFASIFFALEVADAFLQGEDAVVAGSYPIIYIFILAADYAASILAYFTIAQLTQTTIGHSKIRGFLSKYNIVIVALISILATIHLGFAIYFTVGYINNYYNFASGTVVIILVQIIWVALFCKALLVIGVLGMCVPRSNNAWNWNKRSLALLALTALIISGILGLLQGPVTLGVYPSGGDINEPVNNTYNTALPTGNSGNYNSAFDNSTSYDYNYASSSDPSPPPLSDYNPLYAFGLAVPVIHVGLLCSALLFENFLFDNVAAPAGTDPEAPEETDIAAAPKYA